MNEDRFHFYKDSDGAWRWKRVAPNGEVVGASSEGYARAVDMRANAKRNGWDGGVVTVDFKKGGSDGSEGPEA